MDRFVAESRIHHEHSAINRRACGRSVDGFHMTDIAADRFEQRLARLRIRSRGEGGIARRRLSTANELSEVIDVG